MRREVAIRRIFGREGFIFELPRLELRGLARHQVNIHFSVPRYVEYCSAIHSSFLFIANNSLNLSHWTYLGAYLGGLGVTSRGGAALPYICFVSYRIRWINPSQSVKAAGSTSDLLYLTTPTLCTSIRPSPEIFDLNGYSCESSLFHFIYTK